ncbi:MAG TPA: hypothetical protein VK447_04930 [Myxococcaceae bacterium]|nr:hypothetical protein [Myxococcaceae bacterium]
MKTVQAHISQKQLSTSLHPLFARLDGNAALAEVLPFFSGLSFWVVAQQDLFREVDGKMQDLKLRKVARFYRAVAAGQDKWFMNDVVKVEGRTPDASELFGPRHAVARDAAFAVMAEAKAASSDAERLVVLQALEAANYLLVEAVASYFERMNVTEPLQFFSAAHLDAMAEHEVLRKQIDGIVAGLEMSEAERDSACARVDRIFAAFRAVLDGSELTCQRAARRPAFHMVQRLSASESGALRAA